MTNVRIKVTPAARIKMGIAPGAEGPPGEKGDTGNAATIQVGTTTTLPPGSNATVTNAGSSSAAVFNFGIPEGEKGDQGDPGNDGAAATIQVGTVTTVGPDDPATVTNVGTSSEAVFDFEIPQGEPGDITGPASSTDGNAVVFDGTTGKAIRDAGAPPMLAPVYDPQGIEDDAFDRANHTGTQAIATVAGLQAALDAKADAVQNNLSATTDPTDNDDESEGYEVLSLWFNTVSEEIFRCFDATEGAAVWLKTTLTLDELGGAATLNVGTTAGTVAAGDDSRITGAVQGGGSVTDIVVTDQATYDGLSPPDATTLYLIEEE